MLFCFYFFLCQNKGNHERFFFFIHFRGRGERDSGGARDKRERESFQNKRKGSSFSFVSSSLLSLLLSFAMPSKKKADDGEVSFEMSVSAPASQTSIVVDDAWPSEKKRSKEMRWSSEPKSKPKEIKVWFRCFFFLLARSSQPLLLLHSHFSLAALSLPQPNRTTPGTP